MPNGVPTYTPSTAVQVSLRKSLSMPILLELLLLKARSRSRSIENYLLSIRLPWKDTRSQEEKVLSRKSNPPTRFDSSGLPIRSDNSSSSSDPSSAMNGSTTVRTDSNASSDSDLRGNAWDIEYLKYKDGEELDKEKFAILPNDWPYDVPKDVRHIVVWSKVSSKSRQQICFKLSVLSILFHDLSDRGPLPWSSTDSNLPSSSRQF